jgi:hypothetical protein
VSENDHVLMLVDGTPPWPGWRGPQVPAGGDACGRRAWGLGQGLAAHGLRVTYALPPRVLALQPAAPDVPVLPLDGDLWRAAGAVDVVLAIGWEALAAAGRAPCPVVLDLPAARLAAAADGRVPPEQVQAKLAALRLAGRFTCAGPRQQLYFRSWLLLAGLTDAAADLAVVPWGAGEELAGAGDDWLAPQLSPAPWEQVAAPLAALVRAAARSPQRAHPAPPPLPAPAAPAAPAPERLKSWRELLGEVRYHYRHGGLRAVAENALGFARKLWARLKS